MKAVMAMVVCVAAMSALAQMPVPVPVTPVDYEKPVAVTSVVTRIVAEGVTFGKDQAGNAQVSIAWRCYVGGNTNDSYVRWQRISAADWDKVSGPSWKEIVAKALGLMEAQTKPGAAK